MSEEKIKISVNEEDVQNIINCYEKDIEYIKELEDRINKAINKIDDMFNRGDEFTIIDDLIELDKLLKGDKE